MAKKPVDISAMLGKQFADVPSAINSVSGVSRTIDTITGEIKEMKKTAGDAIIGIGQRLIEAKALLSHGEWLPWLTEQVEFSERTATRFMRLAREWSNQTALSDLGATKALTLLALPAEERENFMEQNHIVDGEEKNVIDMSARELEQAVRDRDEARKVAEESAAKAEAAEQSRAKMETDFALLKQLHESSKEAEEQAKQELESANAELQALRDKPVDVAVMSVDQEALDRARAEAISEMQAKVDQAEEARKKAEAKRKSAEAAVDAEKVKATAELREQMAKTEAELMDVRRKLEDAIKAEKQAALNSDQELATFNVIFGEVQEQVNKLHGLLLKVRARGDKDVAGKLQKALMAIAEAIGRCSE
ncbi:DUF3102 domain-containing protein [Oscillibacter sp.]|uniref:DUF3102 domain-containing protein n=1 Tax=Oscillibacter sp. TaxID=1945593 RepID=UPI0028A1F5FD|nr:DUF3102 domain-containing protein [Oscillibacter sp.]